MDDRNVRSATIVMGWVAPVPRRASESEALLVGKIVDEQTAVCAHLRTKGGGVRYGERPPRRQQELEL